MLVCLLLFPSIPAQLLPQPQKGAAEGHSALQILRGSRTFTLMLIACFFGMMGVMPISGFLVTLVTSRGGDSRALGLAQFLMAASELPSALVFGLLRKRLSSAKILLISIVFMAVKPLLILASGSLGMLLAVQPVQMLGYGLFFPASVYFANESVAPADRVQGQSLRTIVAISLSTLLGSLVSGYLLDLGGTTLMLWFSAGCAAVGTAWASPRSPCRKTCAGGTPCSDVLVFVLELIGTVAFAVSGAIVGIKKQMDLFGVIVLGSAAVGGGIVRDVILGITPPATFQDPVYTLTAAAVSVLMFLPHVRARVGRHEPVFDRLLLVMDAVGLGVFTVVGVQCAYRQTEHDTLFLTVFVGLITGVGGGVLRDVFSGERPYIFVRHFYACASIIGALICALCWRALGGNAAMLFGAAAIVVLRLLAAYYHWNLPAPTTTNPERKLPPIEFFRSKTIAPCCCAARGRFSRQFTSNTTRRITIRTSRTSSPACSRRLSSSSRFRQRIASNTSFTLRPQTTASIIPMISSLFIAQSPFSHGISQI